MDIAITSICQMLMMGAAVLLTAMALAEAHSLGRYIKNLDREEQQAETDNEEENEDESDT